MLIVFIVAFESQFSYGMLVSSAHRRNVGLVLFIGRLLMHNMNRNGPIIDPRFVRKMM